MGLAARFARVRYPQDLGERFPCDAINPQSARWIKTPARIRISASRDLSSKNLFRLAQRSGRTNVRDTKNHQILVLVAEGAKKKPPVFEAETATRAIVTCFKNLVLKGLLRKIVAQAGCGVESYTRQIAITHQRAHLVRARLKDKIGRVLIRRRWQIRGGKMCES